MADDVRVTNFPEEGSGSVSRVAYDLMRFLREQEPKPKGRDEWLDLYRDCHKAARGYR